MSDNWKEQRLTPYKIGVMGWLRVLVKGLFLVVLAYSGLVLLLVLRLFERPFYGQRRPWSDWIAQAVSRVALGIIGIGYIRHGKPMREKGAVVANHSTWLDIFTLNAAQRIFFVAKAEVATWPLIGWLARATGTVFIARKGTEAKRQQNLFEERLRLGHQLLFFPEGTSTDSIRVLPFKSTLFEAFYTSGLDRVLHIQPVSVVYHAPKGEDPRFYGWWGDMEFASNFIKMLAAPRHGRVEVTFHPSVAVDVFDGRKTLSHYCEDVIRDGLKTALAQK